MKAIVVFAMILWFSVAKAESVPLIREQGTFVVPVLINDKITLKFTVDSGAADVSIPADVFSTLIRAETISQTDMLGSGTYVLADGSEQRARRFRIRTLRVGTLELHDVVASVAPISGSLLLGQSFLGRLSFWSIDNQQHLLVMNEAPSYVGSPYVSEQPSQRPTATTAFGPQNSNSNVNYESKCSLAQTMCSDSHLTAGCNEERSELVAANYYCSGVTSESYTTRTMPRVSRPSANLLINYDAKCSSAQTMCSDPHLSAGCNEERSELAAANFYCSGVTTH